MDHLHIITLSSTTSNLFFRSDPYEQCEDLHLLNHELTAHPERENGISDDQRIS